MARDRRARYCAMSSSPDCVSPRTLVEKPTDVQTDEEGALRSQDRAEHALPLRRLFQEGDRGLMLRVHTEDHELVEPVEADDEHHVLLSRAREKLKQKCIDLVVYNDVSRGDIGFDAGDNEIVLITAGGERRVTKAPKERIAVTIVDTAEELLRERAR